MSDSIIKDIAFVLDTYPEGTVLVLREGEGKWSNTAFRTPDLEGNLSWALGGKAKPFTSELLAKTIVVQDLAFYEMELA